MGGIQATGIGPIMGAIADSPGNTARPRLVVTAEGGPIRSHHQRL